MTVACREAKSQGTRAQDNRAGWIFDQEVTYRENHDPDTIWLANGQGLQVLFGKPSWDEVQNWKPGRKLRLAFSADRGAVIVDAATTEILPVIGGLANRHPLDLLLQQTLDQANSTFEIIDAYAGSTLHWELEIERLYNRILETKHLPQEAQDRIQNGRSAWKEFQTKHLVASGAIFGLPDGIRWQTNFAEYRHRLIRAHAIAVLDLIDPLASAKP